MVQMLRFGICSKCPEGVPESKLINGLCLYHYWTGVRIKSHQNLLPNLNQDLRNWYYCQIEETTWLCENCGEPIPNHNSLARVSAQAHILPKHLFKSVMLHRSNCLHLGNQFGCDCHCAYDNGWFYARSVQEAPVLKIALARFDEFSHLIPPDEVKYLPTLFYERLNSQNVRI